MMEAWTGLAVWWRGLSWAEVWALGLGTGFVVTALIYFVASWLERRLEEGLWDWDTFDDQ